LTINKGCRKLSTGLTPTSVAVPVDGMGTASVEAVKARQSRKCKNLLAG
jgi:hypothetical protein